MDGLFSTVVRTRVEVVAADGVSAATGAGGGEDATVLTVWETHMLRPGFIGHCRPRCPCAF